MLIINAPSEAFSLLSAGRNSILKARFICSAPDMLIKAPLQYAVGGFSLFFPCWTLFSFFFLPLHFKKKCWNKSLHWNSSLGMLKFVLKKSKIHLRQQRNNKQCFQFIAESLYCLHWSLGLFIRFHWSPRLNSPPDSLSYWLNSIRLLSNLTDFIYVVIVIKARNTNINSWI